MSVARTSDMRGTQLPPGIRYGCCVVNRGTVGHLAMVMADLLNDLEDQYPGFIPRVLRVAKYVNEENWKNTVKAG
jgi:hypothetical protein